MKYRMWELDEIVVIASSLAFIHYTQFWFGQESNPYVSLCTYLAHYRGGNRTITAQVGNINAYSIINPSPKDWDKGRGISVVLIRIS